MEIFQKLTMEMIKLQKTPKYKFVLRSDIKASIEDLKQELFDCDIFTACKRMLTCVYSVYGDALSDESVGRVTIVPKDSTIGDQYGVGYVLLRVDNEVIVYTQMRDEIQATCGNITFTIYEDDPMPPKVIAEQWWSIVDKAKQKFLNTAMILIKENFLY